MAVPLTSKFFPLSESVHWLEETHLPSEQLYPEGQFKISVFFVPEADPEVIQYRS